MRIFLNSGAGKSTQSAHHARKLGEGQLNSAQCTQCEVVNKS